MKIKEQRWYEIEKEIVYIYDSGYKNQSISVSVIKKSDLNYYRTNFNLQKVCSDVFKQPI